MDRAPQYCRQEPSVPQFAIMRTCPRRMPHRASITRLMHEVGGTTTRIRLVWIVVPSMSTPELGSELVLNGLAYNKNAL